MVIEMVVGSVKGLNYNLLGYSRWRVYSIPTGWKDVYKESPWIAVSVRDTRGYIFVSAVGYQCFTNSILYFTYLSVFHYQNLKMYETE